MLFSSARQMRERTQLATKKYIDRRYRDVRDNIILSIDLASTEGKYYVRIPLYNMYDIDKEEVTFDCLIHDICAELECLGYYTYTHKDEKDRPETLEIDWSEENNE